MSRPLLSRLAKSFATKLKQEIESTAVDASGAGKTPTESKEKTFAQKLRDILPFRAKES